MNDITHIFEELKTLLNMRRFYRLIIEQLAPKPEIGCGKKDKAMISWRVLKVDLVLEVDLCSAHIHLILAP